jgi:hypothetical protein
MLVRVWLIQEAAGSDALLRVPSSRLSQHVLLHEAVGSDALLRIQSSSLSQQVLIKKPRSRARCSAPATLDSRKVQVTEKQPLNLFEGPLLWKIFNSLLKSTCSFEKERYFRTPFFRKEKR